VRFSLQDIRKHVQRRDGELFVSLHMLRPGESRAEIARLIACYEQWLGQPQHRFNMDDARACVGEYRLANCLIASLSVWYTWRAPDWGEVVPQASTETMAGAGITSPAHLRLALFDYVNAHYAGFLETSRREEAQEHFASLYGLHATDLEYLLSLDSDDQAILVRDHEKPAPTPGEVAALYNQWAFEAALFNASEVVFVIDCAAFGAGAGVYPGEGAMTTGVGAVIKRLCFLARKLGVYYDLAYEGNQENASYLRLTLYGPQDMTGAAQQYGLRLARLCRLLLGYNRIAAGGDKPGPYRSHANTLPSAAIVKAHATVHFLQRAYRFVMDAKLFALLPVQDEDAMNRVPTKSLGSVEIVNRATANEVYDSSIEQAFAEAFTSLARSYAADGWQLEREPEPLLVSLPGATMQGIFIPDFALTRDRHRIYLEILGFWTPSYRERKLQKLQQLKGRQDIVLAFPVEARGAFAGLAPDFPLIEYDGQLSATEVVSVLRRHIDDFAERLSLVDYEAVRRRVREEGWLPERASFAALHCYRRAELAQAVMRITGDGNIDFAPGVGLYDQVWLEHLGASFVEWLGNHVSRRVFLQEALSECRMWQPALNACDETTFEALLGLWPAVYLRRSSIFEATIALAGDEDMLLEDQAGEATQAVPRRVVRERRATYKKRAAESLGKPEGKETSQQQLWE